ncbi:hypothetical protein Ddye_025468 [Dipteronia dyeriana]|uniref:Polyprotein n=1 Tax=Dipteronia dyeriana TaxID=168575 RepID=A0AAD9TL85_9ROSI|nr:hypothetical protein Ddye_025468 [Dipteronia dyeriana]
MANSLSENNPSLSRRVTALVQHRSPPIKEYVQSTALDNCLVLASTAEQYVDLEIGQPLIEQWIKEGYSYLHIGAIRIVLTLHGRKGLPVTARIALLITIYKEYEHAVIGTCLSTLYTGSISLTYYLNFNIPFRDHNLHNCLKVQLQVIGATMMPNSNWRLFIIRSPTDFKIMPLIFPFQVLMIRPVISEVEIPIHSFETDGSLIYTNKINGHFIWDVDPEMCDADCECKACSKVMRLSCKPGCPHRKPDDPNSQWIGLHLVKKKPLPIYDRALQILKSEGLLPDKPKDSEKLLPSLLAPIPCFMASGYEKDFPPLEPSSNHERNLFSRPFVQTTEILPDGSLKKPSQAEQVLNWNSRNARVQNRVLHSIDQKIDQSRVARLDADLHQYINQGYFRPDFDSKEREISQLKDQLDQTSRDHFTNAIADLSQIFIASRTDPQPSTQTIDTNETSDETSDEPTPMVEEPPEHKPQALAPAPKPINSPWFNLEDFAPSQWRRKISEMSAWLDLQTVKQNNNTENILREFVSRFTRSLRDWYQALGKYRQLQLVRCGFVSQALRIIF